MLRFLTYISIAIVFCSFNLNAQNDKCEIQFSILSNQPHELSAIDSCNFVVDSIFYLQFRNHILGDACFCNINSSIKVLRNWREDRLFEPIDVGKYKIGQELYLALEAKVTEAEQYVTPSGFDIKVDQDVFGVKALNEDRDYTLGLRMTWFGNNTNTMFLILPMIHNGIDLLPRLISKKLLSDFTLVGHRFSLNGAGFTPEDLAKIEPIFDDRPYAALAYLSTDRVYKRKKTYLTTSLSLGVIGGFAGRIAQGAQTGIHSWQRATSKDPSSVRPDPMGWQNQIQNNGNFIGQYKVSLAYAIVDRNYVRFVPSAGIELGTVFNYIDTEFELRFGYFKKNFGKTKFSKSNVYLVDVDKYNNPNSAFKRPYKCELYGFFNFNTSFFMHNSTISDMLFTQNANSVSQMVTASPIVVLADAGIVIKINTFSLYYSLSTRTSQIREEDRIHFWGSFGMRILSLED
ncbi:lipid A deacylase LpxR family protein [Saprospiraceae bacterium]|nr:lipid A deacylase LpxR family protein [Saprospiraceae bacterium]